MNQIKGACRSPYGERGLKSGRRRPRCRCYWSLSLRRAWIEICSRPVSAARRGRRSPYGERGLKYGLAVGIDVVCEVALLTESVD